jgi:hypothetical protein
MLGNILFGVAGALIVFAVFVATRQSAYRVERKLELTAPTNLVFAVLNDLRQFSAVLVFFGATLQKRDPGLLNIFEGPATGVGQSWAWSGKEAGKGTLKIQQSVPGEKVVLALEFLEPMKSTATCALTLAARPTGSLVTWSMEGNHNFLGRAAGVFLNMDNLLGADIEKGLAELKTVAEGKQVPAAEAVSRR